MYVSDLYSAQVSVENQGALGMGAKGQGRLTESRWGDKSHIRYQLTKKERHGQSSSQDNASTYQPQITVGQRVMGQRVTGHGSWLVTQCPTTHKQHSRQQN